MAVLIITIAVIDKKYFAFLMRHQITFRIVGAAITIIPKDIKA